MRFHKKQNHKLLAKFLLVVFLLIGSLWGNNVLSQAILPTSRTSWDHSAHPSGWTHTGTSRRSSSFACSGDDGVTFDNSSERIVLQFDSDADVLTFKLKKSSMSGSSFMTVETSIDGSTWTSVGVYGTAGGSTAITDCGNISLSIACGVRFVRWTYTKDAGNCDMDDVSVTKKAAGGCACVAASEPTTNASSINVTPGCFTSNITFTGGNGDKALVVITQGACTSSDPLDQTAYGASTTFGSGSPIGTGFVVYNGTGTSVSVSGLSSGTSYCVEVYEYNGTTANCEENYMLSSSATSTFTTLSSGCVQPHLTGIMINACISGSCSEGDNEIIYGNAGDFSFVANSTNLVLRYDATSPASTTYTDVLTTNTSTTTALNTASGCAGTFVEGTGATIPIGGKFMIIDNAFCPAAYDWTQFCGEGPVYVIYSTDASWNSTGNFGNDPAATSIRYFRTSITTTSGTTNTIDYNYNTASLSPYEDGDYILFDQDGGEATAYGNNGCVVDPILLPIQLNYLSAVCGDEFIHFAWQTATEHNNDFFTLEKTLDGTNFDEIAEIKGSGNSLLPVDYNFKYAKNRLETAVYFRLKQTDYDGNSTFSDLITATCKFGDKLQVFPNPSIGTFVISGYAKDTQIEVLNDLGQLTLLEVAHEFSTLLDLSNYASGIYFLRVRSNEQTQTLKIILSK